MSFHRDLDRRLRGLRAHLDRVSRRRGALPAPQVLVRAPGVEFSYGDRAKPFHSASVGKVMTTTLIGRLVEQGRLALDTPIGTVLPGSEVAGLPAAPGVDVGADVTIEHLLTHTSGLPDFFEPPRGSGSAASITGAVSDPDRRWTPSALLDEARAMPAVGRPGERFHYCDTGFVVLGRVVEEVTGDPFNTVLRQQVLEPAGMARSSTPYGDAVAPGELAGLEVAPFWIGRRELSRALCVSLDWAGGGIVGPPEDFVAFQQALHSGQLISPTLLAHLARPRRRRRPGLHYGAGLVTIRFHEFFPVGLANLPQPVGGVGAFATHMFHYPQQQAHVVINFHGTQQMQASFQTHCRIAMVLRGLTIDAPIGDQLFTPVPSPQ